ncbi:MAG TPA: hypothetical protein VHF46_02400 [Rubrobacteraceae bacterium]|nr:hypothetical protein [Rubrobacteraceae bacterium]
MSHSGGPAYPGEFGPCDPEKVFEFADMGSEGFDPEQEQIMREHLTFCMECRELYERELNLNAFLNSLDFSEVCFVRSISQHVAMALPTRSTWVRIFWGLIASALLVTAFVSLKSNGTEPIILAMSTLGACWGFVAGSAKVAHSALAAAGPILLLVLASGALADLLIVLVVLAVGRKRRVREA